MLPATDSPPRFRVQFPFLRKFGPGLRKLLLRLALLLVPLFVLRGCLLTYIPPDEVGVRQVSFGPGKGLQQEPVRPGYRREISGVEKIHTFPRNLQVMEFTNNPIEIGEGHQKRPAIKVPTVDGYPVDVDVTVLYRIANPFLVVSRFGFGNAYEESVVLRYTDPLVKLHLGALFAEQFYGPRRLDKVRELNHDLAGRFKANGLVLVDVLIRQYDYPETFQALTEQKKIQDQKVLANRALQAQARVQTDLSRVKAEGENLIKVKTSEFNAQITEIKAGQDLYQRQKQAEGDLKVKSAEAQGTQLINSATEGPGSAKLLRLRRGLAILNGLKGPIYLSGDPTDLAHLGTAQGGKP